MPKKFDHDAQERLLDAIVNSEIEEFKQLYNEDYPIGSARFLDSESTALIMAVSYDNVDEEDRDAHLEMVEYLVSLSNLNDGSRAGHTALHVALQNPNIDPRIVKLLADTAPETIDDYALGLARASNNPALFLNILGAPELIDSEKASSKNPLEEAEAYFKQHSVKEALATSKKMLGDPQVYAVYNLKYNDPNIDQLMHRTINSFNSLEEQKEFNRFDAETKELLNSLSFSPIAPITLSALSNDLPIIISPEYIKQIFETISNYIGDLSNIVSSEGS